MSDIDPALEAEYLRLVSALPEDGAEQEGGTMSIAEVLRAHFLVASHFRREGWGLGGIGPRDIGLLQSAVSRQHASFAGIAKWRNLYGRCATLFFGLIQGHAFRDANKRTAFLCAMWQLRRAGRFPVVGATAIEEMTVRVAARGLDAYPGYRGLLAAGDADPEVRFIAEYFRKRTRSGPPGVVQHVLEDVDLLPEVFLNCRESLARLADR